MKYALSSILTFILNMGRKTFVTDVISMPGRYV